MADWDASLAAGTSGGAHTGASLMDEMREALAMITEKTEECEELRRQKCEVEKEVPIFKYLYLVILIVQIIVHSSICSVYVFLQFRHPFALCIARTTIHM